MLQIPSKKITELVAELFIKANYHIREEVLNSWLEALEREETQVKEVFHVMIKNALIAVEESMPICQDTGLPIVMVEQGEDVVITGKPIVEAINDGIEKGGEEGYLRKSVTKDPFNRDNNGNYGPAVIRHKIVPGNELKMTLIPAGCGSEQMSCARMFPPCHEEETVRNFVLEQVKKASSKPCPPTIIGVGIGGDLQESCHLARKALLRPLSQKNQNFQALEKNLFAEINKFNIGPQGLGGKSTVLAVHIEASSCHRANLSIAVFFNCHLGRHKTAILSEQNSNIKTEENIREKLRNLAEKIDLFKDFTNIDIPLSEEALNNLKAGDKVFLNGTIFTARDAAHKRLIKLIQEKKDLPFDLKGQIIYYVGPTPPKPGQIIGSAGPTTSARMDYYTPILLSKELKGMIGKGCRSPEVIEAIKENKAIYFVTYAGAGALLSKYIKKSEVIGFEDLGTEAIRKLEIKGFPAIVAVDAQGNDIYQKNNKFN